MSLNKVILIGNVGKDPDVRYFDSGNAVANVSLATNERGYKLANGTEIPERTEWHNRCDGLYRRGDPGTELGRPEWYQTVCNGNPCRPHRVFLFRPQAAGR